MKHVVFLSEACLKDERLMIFCSKELQRLPLMCTLRKSFSITEILARFGVYVKKFLPIGLYGHTPHKNYILGFLLFYEKNGQSDIQNILFLRTNLCKLQNQIQSLASLKQYNGNGCY